MNVRSFCERAARTPADIASNVSRLDLVIVLKANSAATSVVRTVAVDDPFQSDRRVLRC